ncbi:MAG: hypothetical protein Q9195_006432 [Heterodermia aff. obscurata]
MLLRKPKVKAAAAPPPRPQAPPPSSHPEPPSLPSSPTPDPLTTLSTYFTHLITLLRQKLAQPSTIYEHSASEARLLHHKIRQQMRNIVRHPYFPTIENDISETNFHVVWGRLEAESARWGARGGRDLRRDRGRVLREQTAIEGILREWGVSFGRRVPIWAREKKKMGMGGRFLEWVIWGKGRG